MSSRMSTVRALTFRALVGAAASGADVTSSLTILGLQREVDLCNRCPLGDMTSGRVPWNGVPSTVALVGGPPGADEETEGVPFVGRAGEALSWMLSEAGFTSPLAMLHIIGCRPPLDDLGVALSVGAVDACQVHLSSALERSGAWLVIEVGVAAHVAFTRVRPKEFKSVVGRWRWVDYRLHVAVPHPTFGPESVTLSVIRTAFRASQGLTVDGVPPVSLSSSVSALDARENLDLFRAIWAKQGYVILWSHVLGRNVVVFDPARVRPGEPRVKVPPGEFVWFSSEELARVRDRDTLCRLAALKAVLPFEVVA